MNFQADRADIQGQVTNEFIRRFGGSPTVVVRAPGRVNLIGEHTDYNDGFVLPMALDRAVWIALRPRDDSHVVLYSSDLGEEVRITLHDLSVGTLRWAEYVKGVAWAMRQAGYSLVGWEGVVKGDVPIGAGLSSSAAFELASARAFSAVSGLPWDAMEMALLARRAENEWVGVNCGVMDQLVSALGRESHALLIDCRSLEIEAVPLPPGIVVVLLDTMTRRGLVDSLYNQRRAQCETAAHQLGVAALRDLTLGQLQAVADQLEPVVYRRARHVVSENGRTLQAAEALKQADPVALGRLMNASHSSLRDDFEVSSVELDAMVQAAMGQEGCFGARMTGAGFGGCVVALVDEEMCKPFMKVVFSLYRVQAGLDPAIYICEAAQGAELVVAP